MIDISLNNIKKNYGFNNVLNGISFEINTKNKVSIIGDNGCGKTTILNIISGLENIDSGSLSIRKGLNIGYLTQQPELIYKDKKVKEILYESDNKLLDLSVKLKKYEEKMIKDPYNILLVNKYLDIQEKYLINGGDKIDSLIDKVSFGLKINDLFDYNFSLLSGGEQKRVLLASLIIKKSNILILDEPTNHLDIESITSLNKGMKNFRGVCLFSSYDYELVNSVANRIIEFKEDGKYIDKLTTYDEYLNRE